MFKEGDKVRTKKNMRSYDDKHTHTDVGIVTEIRRSDNNPVMKVMYDDYTEENLVRRGGWWEFKGVYEMASVIRHRRKTMG